MTEQKHEEAGEEAGVRLTGMWLETVHGTKMQSLLKLSKEKKPEEYPLKQWG